jgi:hypothetical protein
LAIKKIAHQDQTDSSSAFPNIMLKVITKSFELQGDQVPMEIRAKTEFSLSSIIIESISKQCSQLKWVIGNRQQGNMFH